MSQQSLYITVIQSDLVWENKEANLRHFDDCLASITGPKHVVVLPEMFSTGFSMAPSGLAEPMEGPTVQWMKDRSTQYKCILTGSLIIEEDGKFYNRLLWVQPNGVIGHYDKKHLFGFAGEDKQYQAGDKRLIASVNGWKINLMVCYDLRFPVWSRNLKEAYDVAIYVANWPQQRSHAWRTLLQARAIENMCYVVGVNRIGNDAKGNHYVGDSAVIGPLGETIWTEQGHAAIKTIHLEKHTLEQTRNQLPFLKDADGFLLQ